MQPPTGGGFYISPQESRRTAAAARHHPQPVHVRVVAADARRERAARDARIADAYGGDDSLSLRDQIRMRNFIAATSLAWQAHSTTQSLGAQHGLIAAIAGFLWHATRRVSSANALPPALRARSGHACR